ncbi:MAG: ATP-binding protein [Nanoarchaeota archaeon]|nr:ATP-binding protein [Nanoarchaeota archaeon]
MEIESLNNWNPWWAEKKVPEALKGVPRTINPIIFKAIPEREIIALTGIRRSGKSTIIYQMINLLLKKYKPEQILYVNLDDEVLKKETLESIYSFYRQQKNPDEFAFVFLDEIQNIEGWERFLKKYYDIREDVKFVISGSSANLLKREFSTLLTGRNLTFTIFPLSFKGYLRFTCLDYNEISMKIKNKILHEFNNYLEFGGFPEVYFKEEEIKGILLKQYFDDIIYKDIVKRHNINAKKITGLAVYLLTNIANPYTIRKIRNFTGLSIDSIRDYISYLEDAYLVLPIDHFSYSLKETSQLPKKSYAIDCGLRNIAGFRFSSDVGRLAENCVRAELLRQEKKVYYWKGKGEVDFVIKKKDNSLTAINVSFSDRIKEREIKSLLEFKRQFKQTKKLILLTRDTEANEGNVALIPLWKWLLG